MQSIFQSISKRIQYLKRIFQAYISSHDSQLTFWHGTPQINNEFIPWKLDQYPMLFDYKANYQGPKDNQGIPLLDYRGNIGKQYNPIAISQYGLGNFNLYRKTGNRERLESFLAAADWLVDNLEPNEYGIKVWMHHFDFEYRDTLKSPWYSGLAQGQGLSVLVRAYELNKEKQYLDAAISAYKAFEKSIDEGGVIAYNKAGHTWIEEYIVHPPTHVLNGLIWALWGVYDYYLATSFHHPKNLYERVIQTIIDHIHQYDLGYWSLYELSGTKLKMIASPFYHSLHIVQLTVMFRLTEEKLFLNFANKWTSYQQSALFRFIALIHKTLFKVFYY